LIKDKYYSYEPKSPEQAVIVEQKQPQQHQNRTTCIQTNKNSTKTRNCSARNAAHPENLNSRLSFKIAKKQEAGVA